MKSILMTGILLLAIASIANAQQKKKNVEAEKKASPAVNIVPKPGQYTDGKLKLASAIETQPIMTSQPMARKGKPIQGLASETASNVTSPNVQVKSRNSTPKTKLASEQ